MEVSALSRCAGSLPSRADSISEKAITEETLSRFSIITRFGWTPRTLLRSRKNFTRADVFWSSAPGAGECVSEESWSQWCGVELILAALINWDSQCRSLTTTVDMRHFYRTITKYFDIYWYILCIKAVFIIYLTVVNLSKWSAFR